MEIRLDAAKLSECAEAHSYLMERMKFPEYYGRNLDALYDCLTELSEETLVRFENIDEGTGYFKSVYHVFKDAEEETCCLTVEEAYS